MATNDIERTQIELEAAQRGMQAMAELLASDDPEASEPETFDAYDAACDRFWDARARAERYGLA